VAEITVSFRKVKKKAEKAEKQGFLGTSAPETAAARG